LILAYDNCQKRHYDKTFQRRTVSGVIRQSSKGAAVFRRRMTLRSKGVVAAALAACILALLGALLAASSGAAGTPAASTSTDGVINVATPTASQLSVIQSAALKQAASAGDASPTMEATVGSMGQAQSLIDPAATQPQVIDERTGLPWASSTVYVVSMHGHFTAAQAGTPPGYPTPSGTVMDLLIDRASGITVGVHIGSAATDLHSLNPTVTKLG
jgi:hypothetical protein